MKFFTRMSRATHQSLCVYLVAVVVGTGCRSTCKDIKFNRPTEFRPIGTQIEYTDTCVDQCSAVESEQAPHTLTKAKLEDFTYREISLEEAVQTALANSTVMRDLGARVLTAPQGASTVFDPALVQMNPGVGEEAALSDFDAQWATGIIFNRSERAFNNAIFGGGAVSAANNTAAFLTEVSKTAATGTNFALRNSIDYNRVNRDIRGNLDNSVYNVLYEAEVRHPLLRGGGIAFNRIAGPNAGPGTYRGIIIARINTDIALADFEARVRDFVLDVYTSYWDLYFAYQDLDTRRAGLKAASESWRTAKVRFDSGAADAVDQAVAEQQFHNFERQVQNALSGSLGSVGILTAERNLRLLMGITMNDGQLLRPADGPTRAETVFDWYESLMLGLNRRVEVRRQRWNVRASEYQLLAARNQILPQLDLLGQYRWRGFQSNLLGHGDSAYDNLLSGDLQGWQLGLQMSTPIGNRIGHVAVRHAELDLARNRALLREQQKYIVKELSDSFGELSRSYEGTRTLANELTAAIEQARLRQDRYDAGTEILQFLVQAQSEVANIRSDLMQSLVNYNLAIADIHYDRGTLLDFLGVELAEGGWTQSSFDAARKESRRFQTRHMNYCYTVPCPVSRGRYEQHVLPREELPEPAAVSADPVAPIVSPAEAGNAPVDAASATPELESIDDLGI